MKSKVLLAALSILTITGSFAQDRALSFSWEKVGPDNVVSKSSSILVSTTDADSKTLVLGSESNGIYRSVNKGSSWQKVEVTGMSQFVSGLHQAADGKIYASTGVIPNYANATVPYGYNKIGNGLWVSADGGSSFSQITNTDPNGLVTDFWASINKVSSDPENSSKIYAGTNGGFKISTDGGANWNDPIGVSLPVSDIDAGTGGQIIVSYLGGNSQVSLDGGATFVNIIGSGTGQIPSDSISKVEFAISKANNNIVYACVIKSNKKSYGWIRGIYSSSDKGLTWTLLTPGTTYFAEALAGSGVANCVFEVFPGETTKLLLAGSSYYTYAPSEGWVKRLSSSYGSYTAVSWDPKNSNNLFATTNSGVWRTYTGAYNISSMQSIYAGIVSPDISNISYSSQYSELAPARVTLKFNPKKDSTYTFILNQKINTNGDSSVVTISYKSVASSGNEAEIKTNILNQIKTAVTNGNLFVTVDTAEAIAGELRILITAWKNHPEFLSRGYKNFIADFQKVTYPSSDPTLFVTTQFAGAYYLNNLSGYNTHGTDLNTSKSTSGILAGISKPVFDAGTFGKLSKTNDLGENWSGGENVVSGALWTIAESYVGSAAFTNVNTPVTYSEKQNADSTFSQRLALGSNMEFGTATNTTITQNKPSIWFTKDPLNLSAVPTWYRAAGKNYTRTGVDAFNGNPLLLKFSTNQEYLYVSSNDGTNSYLYRIYIPNQLIADSALIAYNNLPVDTDGVKIKTYAQMDSIFTDIRSSKSLIKVNKIANFGSRSITGVIVDPNDQSRVLITLGGYGFTDYLYLSNNADSCASADNLSNFTTIQGNLSGIPVNSAVIDVENNNLAYLATDEGFYYTENLLEPAGNCSWTNDNTFPAKVATCLTQATNDYLTTGDRGNIYIGTLGKGAYVSKANLRVSTKNIVKSNGIKVYPNPSKGTFTINSDKAFDQVIVRNITGQTVVNKNLNSLDLNSTLNLDLPDGVYVYEVLNKNTRVGSGKVLISKQ